MIDEWCKLKYIILLTLQKSLDYPKTHSYLKSEISDSLKTKNKWSQKSINNLHKNVCLTRPGEITAIIGSLYHLVRSIGVRYSVYINVVSGAGNPD